MPVDQNLVPYAKAVGEHHLLIDRQGLIGTDSDLRSRSETERWAVVQYNNRGKWEAEGYYAREVEAGLVFEYLESFKTYPCPDPIGSFDAAKRWAMSDMTPAEQVSRYFSPHTKII